jgi:hypothetical protein
MKKSRLLVTRISFIRNTSAEIKEREKGGGKSVSQHRNRTTEEVDGVC